MPQTNDLTLRPISELMKLKFFIPSYQRGYRWTRRQVTDLLDDIAEFQKSSETSSRKAFYCLQPVVVKQSGDEWELVDGQQRLTTICIILLCLKNITAMLGHSGYSLRYETRPESADFLMKISSENATDNIDFFHMNQAKETIEEWFSNRPPVYKLNFIQTLLNDDEAGKNVKVIWYQLSEHANVTDVFSRLNRGKIPLTNSELVKALFLNSGNFNLASQQDARFHQLKIAQEWDETERHLQQDDFWYFISNHSKESNRIEFILSLVADSLKSGVSRQDPNYIFLTFVWYLGKIGQDPDRVKKVWLLIKQRFMLLDEWYCGRMTYHLVGYLISSNEGIIPQLVNESENCITKSEFIIRLKQRILESALPSLSVSLNRDISLRRTQIDSTLSALTYPDRSLRPVLLLFNIAILLANRSSMSNFPFRHYKLELWDIEHITSVSSQMPENISGQKAWTEVMLEHLRPCAAQNNVTENKISSQQLLFHQADTLLKAEKFDTDGFEDFFSNILKEYTQDPVSDRDDSIGNLTLLDQSTNRSYRNAIFPVKRNRIIQADKTSTFVPLGTRNVFLKYYSRNVHEMTFWSSQDQDDYRSAITETLAAFFEGAMYAPR
ncbi:DUF262 domain-containing protein [Yersinia bercovieri]|uniref:DUF262 domain-containing protein n=1 Tax=Yersinia bercovieri TaxID=634 RepID=UPI001CFC7DD2|nr:DUF262 domain-containing protein [Yersinia bercovieri]MCB5301987.1 DUF262 domain-containing HNH endonuclease family protein [Yersinia bercovieri]